MEIFDNEGKIMKSKFLQLLSITLVGFLLLVPLVFAGTNLGTDPGVMFVSPAENQSDMNSSLRFLAFNPNTPIVETWLEKNGKEEKSEYYFSATVSENKNISMVGTRQYISSNPPTNFSYPIKNLTFNTDTVTGKVKGFTKSPGLINVTINATNGRETIEHSWLWVVHDVTLNPGTLPKSINQSQFMPEKKESYSKDNDVFRFISIDPQYPVVEKKMETYDGVNFHDHTFTVIVNRGDNVCMNESHYLLYPNGTLHFYFTQPLSTFLLNNESTLGIGATTGADEGMYYVYINATHQQETAETSWVFIFPEPGSSSIGTDNDEDDNNIFKKILIFFGFK
ncbi:MAG: hypothetical protein LUQ50_09260 [Methanospirillum sp.]|uniref:hypothetical protein n=1 Tax=Methanospirillum sp. TaxID=45200 RepID=UPI002374F31D|nr:hypothetical protein [Methanospirillum sp.]MDD1729247.1 hypothetical protein [Methanospirillum sp.]